MENKLNYPIKYAVLELKVRGNWKNDYNEKTVGFIASKCHVISQNIRYLENGTSKLSYQVVFPYINIEGYKNRMLRDLPFAEIERVPSFGPGGDCLNATIVPEIFDTYDEASEVAKNENYKIQMPLARALPISIYSPLRELKREEKRQKLDSELAICKSFEQDILKATSEMTISEQLPSAKQLVKK